MSQKSIFKKITAFMVAVYMILGNVSMLGIGLSKVIAEDSQIPQMKIEQQLEKYVQYDNQSGKGVVLKTKTQIAEDITSADQYQSIKNVQLEITTPQINGQNPERVGIVNSNTALTNGIINGEINQNYDSNSGLLIMSYENKDNYSEYKENAKDEFEIVYIYAEGAYTGNSNEIIANTTVKAKVEYNKENKTAEKTENYKIKLTENIGYISQIEITNVSDIYKGYMYSNEENNTNYETTFTENETVEVLNNELMDELTINENAAKFVTDKYEDANIEYKATTVTEDSFIKMLGQDGYIDVYVSNEKYATIRYADADKDGNRKYIVEYTNGEQKETSGKVEYTDGVKQIQLIISNPITEGKIELLQEKVIKADQTSETKDIKSIKEVKTVTASKEENIIDENKEEKIIELKEPTTQMSLELSNSNLSTLTTNKTTLTVKLNDTNSSCKLFEEGKMEITLPANLVSAKIISARSLYVNGLKIANAKIENEKLILTIEGKQTAYDIEAISGGVNIVIDLELDIDDTTPSHQETMQLTYGKASVSTTINIVSKYGLLMLNNVTTENKKEVTLIGNEQKTLDLSMNQKNQKVEQKINLVNNYDSDITSTEMIGTIGYNTENVTSNFDVKLINEIKTSNKNVKVYYSETTEEYNWKENYTENAKAYKIEMPNNTMKSKEQLEINIELSVPESLSYNKESYLNTKVDYNYNNTQVSQSSIVKMATYQKEENALQVSVQTIAGDRNVNSEDEIFEGQTLKSKITLKNNASYDSTYKITTLIENAVYYEKYETGYIYNEKKDPDTRYAEAEIDDLYREYNITVPANSTAEYEYQYVVSKGANNVSSRINVLDDSNNKAIDEITVQNAVKSAKMKLRIAYTFNEESPVMETMNATLSIQNYTDEELRDVIVKVNLSKQLEPDSFEYYGDSNIELEYDDETNVMEVNIDKINANETLSLVVVYNVSLDNNSASEDVSLNASCEYDGEQYLSNNFTKTAYQTKSNLQMKVSNNLNKEKVETGDRIEYTLDITNSGVLDLNNSILKFIPSDGVIVNNAYIVYSDGTKEEIDLNELENTTINLKAEDNLSVIYNITIEEVSERMENIFILSDEYWNVLTETSVLSGEISEKDSSDENDQSDENNQEKPSDDENQYEDGNTNTSYSLSGTAWMDSNKDGQRDAEEQLLNGINVTLINAETGEVQKDNEGNNLTATTDENGNYTFSNLETGTYLVMFEFDTNKYTVTTYQKEGIDVTSNSDAIINNVTIEGATKLVGITDNLEIADSNLENIDIGLIENAIFDLSLNKQISSITVTNAQGTKTTEYNNKNFVKVDLVAKYMNNTNVIVTYKFIIKNEGEVTGYVDRLVDNLPSGLEFSSELNKDWYKGSDGNLYTTSLSGIAIAPGETSETELILTKKTTENTTGTFSNNAEIDKISNLEAIEEKTDAQENNKSSADIVISIKTGSAVMYIGITIGCLAVIGAGAYMIKKKVLNRGIL